MSDWRADALCAQVGGDMFFPETTDTSATRAAKRICADCLVRAECLNEALQADRNPPGVLGGTSKGDRRRIRAAMRKANTMSVAVHERKRCDAPGCDRPARSSRAEWCDLHRQRMRANGSFELVPELRPIEDRFWEKVDRRGDDECWPWMGAPDAQTGYGRISLGRRGAGGRGAHRVSYEINVGPIPDGLEIDHLCVNRICVNPRHLEPVTHEENTRRAKRRWTHCVNGHEFDERNTYWRKEGRRVCRTCARDRKRK